MFNFSMKAQKLNPVEAVTVYVRNNEIMDREDVVELAMRLSQNPPQHWGLTMPDYAFITERQYQALPMHLQALFSPKTFQPERL